MSAGPGRLHVITDETLQTRFSHVELAALAADGGADTVQFREKRARDAAELERTAHAMRERLAGRAKLIVNDRLDLALAVHADGVHLGPGDADPLAARRLLGRAATIGTTVNDRERARAVRGAPVDYVGVGPVFGTRSKRDPAPALGLEGLRRIVDELQQPVIAIGNITPERVEAVLAAGAFGIAVLSAVVCGADPRSRVEAFARAVERALGAHAT